MWDYHGGGNIVINTGGNRPGNGYWDRYDARPGAGGYQKPRTASSPIPAARPTRPEMKDLQARTPRPMPTATRARFLPGEDRAGLAEIHDEAQRLLALL